MTDKRKPYKTFTREFKIEAVRLMETSERSSTELAMELGVRRNQLYKWKEQLAGKENNWGQTPFIFGFLNCKRLKSIRQRISNHILPELDKRCS